MGFDPSDDIAGIFEAEDGPSVAAVYTPPGGSPVPVNVIPTEDTVIADTSAGEVLDQADFLTFLRSEVSKPAEGSRVAITGGETFLVLAISKERRYTTRAQVRKVS